MKIEIAWTEKHKGTPGTRSDYRQIDGWWLGTLCRIDDLAPGRRWNWTVFTDDERGPSGTADDERGAKDAASAALRALVLEALGLRWIPVGERLPRAAQCVMVPNPMSGKVPFKEQPRYVERYYNRNLGIWLDLDGRTVDPPTHWMPLPAPPETA